MFQITAHEMLRDIEENGGSIRELIRRLGLDRNFLYRVRNNPNYGVGVDKRKNRYIKGGAILTNYKLLWKAYKEQVGYLYSDEVERLFTFRDDWYHDRPYGALDYCLFVLLPCIRQKLEHERLNALDRARLKWLEAEIHSDWFVSLAPRQESIEVANEAVWAYQEAYDLINDTDVEESLIEFKKRELFKLCSNIMSIEHGRLKSEERVSPKHLQKIRDLDYLNNLKNIYKYRDKDWLIPRTGLSVASLLEEKEEMLFFFKELVRCDKRFEDLRYQHEPHAQAIADDSDCANFINYLSSVRM